MLDSILLSIAKNSILMNFDSSYTIDKDKILSKYHYLSENGSSFVTLKTNGELRGCIGSVIAHRTLLEDIISNAKSAAFKDPRFKPLEKHELSELNMEVSVLSEPKLLEYEDDEDLYNKIRPNIDGVILQYGSNQATFLPQVWLQLKTPELFLEYLSTKAGLNKSIYKQHPIIYTYGVEAIEKDYNEIPSI